MAIKVFAPKSYSFGSIKFALGFAYVTDADVEKLKNVSPEEVILVNRSGDPLNCKSSEIKTDSNINPEFIHLLPPEHAVEDEPEVEQEEPEKSSEPDSSWTKAEIKIWMDDNGMSYNSGDTKPDLLQKIAVAEK